MMSWKRMLFIGMLIRIGSTYGQDVYFPKEGDKIADHTFTDLENYPEKTLAISDYKGKWLVIDLWSRGCGRCIASFPKMNKLDEQFKGRVKLLMVGVYKDFGGNATTDRMILKDIFTRRAEKYKLHFSVAYDSLVLDKYDIGGVPVIFVINPDGIIAAKTTGLDSTILAGIMAREKVAYDYSYSSHEKRPDSGYNYKLPLLSDGKYANGGYDTSLLWRSMLIKWNPKMPQIRIYGWGAEANGNVQESSPWAEAIGMDLPELFRIAYTGRTTWNISDSLYDRLSRKVILEVNDTIPYKRHRAVGRNSANAYGYSLITPNEAKYKDGLLRRKLLLEDLHRYLRVTSRIEKRRIEVYKIVVVDSLKVRDIRSKGAAYALKQATINHVEGQYRNIENPSVWIEEKGKVGMHIYNYPFKRFLISQGINKGLDAKYGYDFESVPPIIDQTGIDFNIDLDYNGDITDWDDNLAIFRKHGLDIVKGEAEMDCIIVKDTY